MALIFAMKLMSYLRLLCSRSFVAALVFFASFSKSKRNPFLFVFLSSVFAGKKKALSTPLIAMYRTVSTVVLYRRRLHLLYDTPLFSIHTLYVLFALAGRVRWHGRLSVCRLVPKRTYSRLWALPFSRLAQRARTYPSTYGTQYEPNTPYTCKLPYTVITNAVQHGIRSHTVSHGEPRAFWDFAFLRENLRREVYSTKNLPSTDFVTHSCPVMAGLEL